MDFNQLTERQLDALREISNVGMGRAATALSQLTGKTILLNVPQVKLMQTAEIQEYLGGAERRVVGIYLRMLGNAQGNILMVFPLENAGRILEKLLPRSMPHGEKALTELELSALKEVGNILASAYLNALGELLSMTLLPSVPILAIDTVAHVVGHALAEFCEVGQTTLLLDTQFIGADEPVSSQFFLLPSSSSLRTLLEALGMDRC